MKPWAEKFYKSRAWQEVRQAYFIYRHGICERCGRPGEIVHHKEYLTPLNINDPNITLSFDNLELLCLDCHNKEHSKQDSVKDGLMFDDDGNLIQSPRGLENSGLFRDRRAAFRKPRNRLT
ncbi:MULTISPECIES: HNH endonuclease signature motif containing protein [Thermoanaerobacterium]|uniref:Putative HNH nuclease YajD n=2 Tax=Thermoanaerobacterium TaxID=28895 RepID=W9E7Y3_9THEO|nr:MULTISPECIES: HNH endonuclease signature motif containing protein [Thermoanaerobacterium]AFK87427.1 HNH endonuclease [Thermoanaerobacterium saccharolyticum JW/SL-YS485]ETO37798.1 HNH endonuclease [Thermoanaerobacterium aotearoense SCUT27]